MALWPDCRQAPHNRFDGGFEVEGVVRVGGVVMVVRVLGSLTARVGVPALLVGFGAVGSGHVMSISSDGQNCRMLSCRYQLLSRERPLG